MSQQRLAQKLTRFNNQAGSSRRYQTFTESKDAKGRSVHTYGDGTASPSRVQPCAARRLASRPTARTTARA
jgi:hypothetical protein